MPYTAIEIDFLPVSDGSKSGDAIAVRAWLNDDEFHVLVIDGGTRESGEALVEHVTKEYGAKFINHMVATHSDQDHASGLREVMSALPVEKLWIHQPWLFAEALLPRYRDPWSVEGLARHLRNECFACVTDLVDMAEDAGVPLGLPFAGSQIGPFTVLGPSVDYYLDLVPRMSQTPRERAAEAVFREAGRVSVTNIFEAARAWVEEHWHLETLGEPGADATSAPNNSSVILFTNVADVPTLLTGDAGVEALWGAIAYAEARGLPIRELRHVQIPHHGARRNASPAQLDYLLGKAVPEGEVRGYAIASSSKGDTKHPRPTVLNAYKRRGFQCNATEGELLNWTSGRRFRTGISAMAPLPFMHRFEA